MAHAGPSPELYDAPEEVARLYRVWRDGPVGDRYGLLWDLEHAMYVHRPKWMIVDDEVIYMTGTGQVRIEDRSKPYRMGIVTIDGRNS